MIPDLLILALILLFLVSLRANKVEYFVPSVLFGAVLSIAWQLITT